MRGILPLLVAMGAAFPDQIIVGRDAGMDPGPIPPKPEVPDDVKLARMYRKEQKKHHRKKNRRGRR